MKENNYLVSVFVGGKCADLFFSEDLCELHVCRLLFKGCEIEVHDLRSYRMVPDNEVERREREINSIRENKSIPDMIVCQETKRIYRSLDDCAKSIGISVCNLTQSIMELTSIKGRHYLFSNNLFK